MLSAALSLAVTVFVLIAVPGPSNLYIVGQTLASGRRAAFFSVIGNAVGFAAIGAAVVLVLGELLQRTDWLQTALVLVGVTVLAILAVAYLREARREWSGEEQDRETVMVSTSFRRAFFSGLVVGVTNPKGPILFGTIVPGFLPANVATYPAFIWLALFPLAIGPLVDSFWVVCALAARGWIMRAPRGLAVIKAVGGLMLLLMAGYMLLVEA